MLRTPIRLVLAVIISIAGLHTKATAQCTEQPPVNNHLGPGTIACPCFIPGEQAGAVFTLPAAAYPVEILKVGIGWAIPAGGTTVQLEQAIHIYAGGLPNPGAPQYTLLGPQLTSGAINEFDLSFLPGNKIIQSGPFTVTLEFLNSNYNDYFVPTVVHDGTGGILGRNVVYASPGGWLDAVLAGVSGNWVFFVKYRSLKPVAQVGPSAVVFNGVPAYSATYDTVAIRNTGCDTLRIAGIVGCDTSPFSVDTTATAHTIAPGDSTHLIVCVMPTTQCPDACSIDVISNAGNGTQTINVSLGTVTSAGAPDAYGTVSIVPNPFNPSTTIRFSLPEAVPVDAGVYTVDGQLVRALAHERMGTAGENTFYWDGRDERGAAVASGVYLVRIATPLGNRTARAVLLK